MAKLVKDQETLLGMIEILPLNEGQKESARRGALNLDDEQLQEVVSSLEDAFDRLDRLYKVLYQNDEVFSDVKATSYDKGSR